MVMMTNQPSIESYLKSPKDILNQVISSCAGELDQLAIHVQEKVKATFRERFSTRESLQLVPELWIDKDIDESFIGKLVRTVVMVQHDSLGDQFFVPLALDLKEGTIHNMGLFSSPNETVMEKESVKLAQLMGRRMIVVASLPPPKPRIQSNGKILVLLYNEQLEIKVNDLLQVIGIFQGNFDNEDSGYPHNLSILHALVVHPYQPLMPTFMDADDANAGNGNVSDAGNDGDNHNDGDKDMDKNRPSLSVRKQQTIDFLKKMGFNGNDSMKVLMALLSRISGRSPGLFTSLLIGNFPLNIRVNQNDNSKTFVNHIASMIPSSIIIELSLSELEQGQKFTSSMNYESGELDQGRLQVPQGTLIIIDERFLQVGKLSEVATKNLTSLIELVTHQTVHYDFGGQSVVIPMNNPIITISHGKSILPIEEHVDLPPSSHDNSSSDNDNDDDDEGLAKSIPFIREYLQYCRTINVGIEDNVANQIEQLYMKERKAGATTTTTKLDPNCLSRILNFSRLIAASNGSCKLTLEHYQEAATYLLGGSLDLL